MSQNLQEYNEEITNEGTQDSIFQAYLDRISKLMIDYKLREAEHDDDVSVVARAHTLAVLGRLDPAHKGKVVQFLSESGLIRRKLHREPPFKQAPYPVIRLREADLSSAELSRVGLSGDFGGNIPFPPADLEHANLSRANLSNAILHLTHLSGANLTKADLSGAALLNTELRSANLTGADLSNALMGGADLSGANLRGAKVTDEQLDQCRSLRGTTMPDGSKHD